MKEKSSEKFAPKKSLGQNFLTSAVVPTWMCDAANLLPSDTVLEIGPGTGKLTDILLKRGVRVVAVEADLRAVTYLKQAFKTELETGQLQLFHGDIKDLTPAILDLKSGEYVAVANIPYYLSGYLLRLLLSGVAQPKTLVFLMQKELVERIARAKKESLLSLSVKAFGQPHYIKTVTRGHFLPQPKVDSAILAVRDVSTHNFRSLAPDFFFDLLHLGLGKKRKQLMTNLCERYQREEVTAVFSRLGFLLTVRGEDLALAEWLELAKALTTMEKNLK